MMRPPLEMLLVIVALARHTRGLPYGELPSQLQTREYTQGIRCTFFILIYRKCITFIIINFLGETSSPRSNIVSVYIS